MRSVRPTVRAPRVLLGVKRLIVSDDFTALPNDLFAKKITSPRRLGIQGGSNVGLLIGVQFTQDENTEGGHGAGADLKQAARTTALTMTYLQEKLMN